MNMILLRIAVLICLFVAHSADAQWTEPVLLPPPINVNPPGEYYYSAISADGQILCMTIFTDSTHGGYGDDDVWFSERIGDSAWTVPVSAGPNVNNNQRNLSPSITNDRQRLYYVCWTGFAYHIFVSQRTGPDWDDWSPGAIAPLPLQPGSQLTAQIAYDDSTLIFTSTGQDSFVFGQPAMYTSCLQPDSTWTPPDAIAPHLNWQNGSYHPCLTDSGRTLVYAQSFGGGYDDIYYAFRNDTGFGQAYRCDSTVNTMVWDSDPSCPADGASLYFDSRRGEFSVARLYVARRVTDSLSAPRSREMVPQRGVIEIIPNIGSAGTDFQIVVPFQFRGLPVRVFNPLG